MARNYKKHIVWQGQLFVDYYDASLQEAYRDTLDANGWNKRDYSIDDFVYDECEESLDAEMDNLSSLTYDNSIIAIADLGRWDGRHSAYLEGGIFSVPKVLQTFANYNTEFYVSNTDLCATTVHHDGRNYWRFRRWKDGVTASQKMP